MSMTTQEIIEKLNSNDKVIIQHQTFIIKLEKRIRILVKRIDRLERTTLNMQGVNSNDISYTTFIDK